MAFFEINNFYKIISVIKHCRCENGGTCDELQNRMICVCPEGFAGEYCQRGNSE